MKSFCKLEPLLYFWGVELMKFLKRVSSRLVILSLVPLVIFGSIIFGGMKVTSDRYENSQQLLSLRLQQTQRLNIIARTFNSNIIDTAHKARSGMVLWSDGAALVNDGKNTIVNQWQQFKQAQLSSAELNLVKQAEPLYQNALVAIDTIAEFMHQSSSYSMGNYVDLQLYAALEPLLLKLDELTLLQKRLSSEEVAFNTQLNDNNKNHVDDCGWPWSRWRFCYWGCLLIGLFVNLWCIYVKTMADVEKHSNLGLRVDIHTENEFDEIGVCFNAMMERIVGFVGTLVEIGASLDDAADNTLNACREVRSQVNSTQDELSNAATSIEQMAKSVEIIAQYTEQTTTVSKDADSHASNNFTVIKQATGQIRSLAEAINDSAEQVNVLREHGQQINSVLGVIKAVAEQTNLLALNAAIEAARAGEQGRGFAVVADEVRSLAQRTQESTQEIEIVIANIREATDEAASQMRRNAQFADEGAQTISATEQSLQVIMGSFSDIINKNESMNSNYSEQLQAVRGVNDMVLSIFNLSQKSTNNTQKVLNNAKDVENLSLKLKTALSQFCY